MPDSDNVRLRLPSTIKAGDIVQVRVLVLHPMERVERDAQGKIIQKNYNYVNKVIVTYLGKTILTFDTSQGSLAPGGPDPVQTLTFSSGPRRGRSLCSSQECGPDISACFGP